MRATLKKIRQFSAYFLAIFQPIFIIFFLFYAEIIRAHMHAVISENSRILEAEKSSRTGDGVIF